MGAGVLTWKRALGVAGLARVKAAGRLHEADLQRDGLAARTVVGTTVTQKAGGPHAARRWAQRWPGIRSPTAPQFSFVRTGQETRRKDKCALPFRDQTHVPLA